MPGPSNQQEIVHNTLIYRIYMRFYQPEAAIPANGSNAWSRLRPDIANEYPACAACLRRLSANPGARAASPAKTKAVPIRFGSGFSTRGDERSGHSKRPVKPACAEAPAEDRTSSGVRDWIPFLRHCHLASLAPVRGLAGVSRRWRARGADDEEDCAPMVEAPLE